MFWAGLSDLYSLSVACDCIWCLPWVYWALAVFACTRALAVMWHFGRLVWIFFRCAMVVCTFFMSFLGGKCYLRKSLGVWDSNIAATRQQTKERLEKYRDIFETQFYCMVACWYFMVFIFELQLWKKLVFYHLLGCCFTICCEWQIFHLFGMKLNLVTTLLLSNLHNSCVNSWNRIDWQRKFVGSLLSGWFAYCKRADYFHSSLSVSYDNALHQNLSCFNLGTYSWS